MQPENVSAGIRTQISLAPRVGRACYHLLDHRDSWCMTNSFNNLSSPSRSPYVMFFFQLYTSHLLVTGRLVFSFCILITPRTPGVDQLRVANHGWEYPDADRRWIGVVISVTSVPSPLFRASGTTELKLTFIPYNAGSNVMGNVVRFLKDSPRARKRKGAPIY